MKDIDTDKENMTDENSQELNDFDTEDNLEEVNSSTENEQSGTDLTFIMTLQAEVKELQNKYLYAMAEMDNMKKRFIKERSELRKYEGENISRDLLEILDDLERTKELPNETPSSTILEGLGLISARMKSIFERYQITGEDSKGQKFDPFKHEALTAINSDEIEAGIIIQQLRKAFYIKDKLLRPAQVVVSSGPFVKKDEIQENIEPEEMNEDV